MNSTTNDRNRQGDAYGNAAYGGAPYGGEPARSGSYGNAAYGNGANGIGSYGNAAYGNAAYGGVPFPPGPASPFPTDPASSPSIPAAQGTDALGRHRVVTVAELAAVRRIGVKAAAWSAAFILALAAAALAWAPASVNSPAVARGALRLPQYAWEWAVRYPWLGAAYPWLAGGAFALLVVEATYLLGWYRAAGVVRDAEAGDAVAITYLKKGPRLGSVEWWWTNPPVRPKSEGRKVARIGVAMVLTAIAVIAIAVFMIVLDWGRPGGRALGPAYPAAMLLSAVPVVALAAWCFVFTARPSAGKVKAAGVMRWVLVGVGLLGLAAVWWLSARDGGGVGGVGVASGVDGASTATVGGLGAIMVGFYGMVTRMIGAVRTLATMSLDRYITVPTPRARIDAELRRMGESEQQQAFDGTNASGDRVNRRRERRLALRAALYVIGFVALVAVVSWIKARTGMA